jgi:hypothetical protein
MVALFWLSGTGSLGSNSEMHDSVYIPKRTILLFIKLPVGVGWADQYPSNTKPLITED